MKKKLLFGIIGVIAIIALVSAATEIFSEPWNTNQRGGNHNLTEMEWISADTLNGTNIIGVDIDMSGNLTGELNWTYLWNYPSACSGSGAIYQLGDTLTCSTFINVSENVTASNIISTDNIYVGTGTEWMIVYLSGSIGYFNSTYPIEITNNLTITDKITFRLGEVIDNLVDGWITITGNLDVSGNITAENVHLPSYLSTHTNTSITAVEGVWLNVTFDTHDDTIKNSVNHTYSDATNETFTITSTGVYNLHYGISYLDTAASPDNVVAIRLIKDSSEIHGSVFEKDTTKQNALGTIYRSVMASLTVGDEIKLQFISNSTTVSMQTPGTYGVHPTSANLNIQRIS